MALNIIKWITSTKGYELLLPETKLEALEELMNRPMECLLFGINYSQVVIDYIKELEDEN